MPVQATEKGIWEELPKFVIINPILAGMFDDRELSGLYLSQYGGTDEDGNDLSNWGHVPKENNCSRIKTALDVNNLFPCNPKGECRLIPPPIMKEDSVEELMKRNTRELIALLPNISDAKLLSDMRGFEDGKGKKDRRTIIVQKITERMREADVHGVTSIASTPATITDSDGNVVPDEIRVG